MHEYKYVEMDFENRFAKNELCGHREIIDSHAKEGWRFLTAIPTKNIGYGNVTRVELVFEREIEKK